MNIPLEHIEEGLRSFDRAMPEEVMDGVGLLAGYLFAPTETTKENLPLEGIDEGTILVTGNTVVDAVYQNLMIAKDRDDILKTYGVEQKGYFLGTPHRLRMSIIRKNYRQLWLPFQRSIEI